jgi:hypothetical protein
MNFIAEEFDIENLILTIGINHYSIYPGDSTFVCLWLPTTNVKIVENKSKQIMQPYNLLITNLVTNEVAHAYKLEV